MEFWLGAATMLLAVAWLLACAHMYSSPFAYQAKMGRIVFWGGLIVVYTAATITLGWHLRGWVS